MSLMITLLAALLITAVVVGVLIWSNKATYRVERSQVVELLESVLTGQEIESNWRMFCDIPIRYDDELESIRLLCAEIDELHFNACSRPPYLLDREGREKLELLLNEARQNLMV